MIKINNVKEVELLGAVVNTMSDAKYFTDQFSLKLFKNCEVEASNQCTDAYNLMKKNMTNDCTTFHQAFVTYASEWVRDISDFVNTVINVLDDVRTRAPELVTTDTIDDYIDLTSDLADLVAKYDDYISWFYTIVINHISDKLDKVFPNDTVAISVRNRKLQDIVDYVHDDDFDMTTSFDVSDNDVQNKLNELAGKADSNDVKPVNVVDHQDIDKLLADVANASDSNKEEDDPFKNPANQPEVTDDDDDPFKDDDDDELLKQAKITLQNPCTPESKPKKATKKKQSKTKTKSKS